MDIDVSPLVLHYNNNLFIRADGYKKVKDLEVGDIVLVSDGNSNYFYAPITDITPVEWDRWYKIDLSNEEHFIFNRDLALHTENGVMSLSDVNNSHLLVYHQDNVSVSSKKEFNKSSTAYQIEIEGSPYSVSVNDIDICLKHPLEAHESSLEHQQEA